MLTGSCLCGNIQYEIRGELGPGFYCHCSRCRKAGGSAFASNVVVAADEFVIVDGKDSLKTFSTAEGVHRVFCGNCGSPIISRRDALPDIVRVRMGTLDTSVPLGPGAHIYVASKAPWHRIHDGLPQYAERPPAGGGTPAASAGASAPVSEDLLELKRELLEDLGDYMQYGGAEDEDDPEYDPDWDAGYTQEHIDACDAALETFFTEMSRATHNRDAILATVRKLVLCLNDINHRCDGSMIETDQREQICDLVAVAATEAGLDTDDDLTEEWREW